MPSFTIYGKKGGGKTYLALLKIIDELAYGDRVVVTTVALKLPELSAYLAKRYPKKNIDVNTRVRILTRQQGREFWLHREWGNDIVECSHEDYAKGLNPDYTAHSRGGIFYVIDEIHVDFDARAWARCGPGLTYYNSQERKLLDDQLYITQFLELVDKRVKGFSQEFLVCRNWRYERFLTIFSKGSGMEVRHYAQPPTGLRDFPNEVHRYKIDPEIAACYDTSAGIGFKGAGRADTQQKGRKFALPMWALFLTAIPVAALAWGADAAVTKAFTKVGNMGSVPTGKANTIKEPVTFGANQNGRADPVYVEGIAGLGRGAVAFLSDGSQVRTSEGATVALDGVRLASGEMYRFRTQRRAVEVQK